MKNNKSIFGKFIALAVTGLMMTAAAFADIGYGTPPCANNHEFRSVSLVVAPGADACGRMELCASCGIARVAQFRCVFATLPSETPGYGFAVSNMTEGTAVDLLPDGRYALPLGAEVGIYCVPEDGYVVKGANPYIINEVTSDTTIDTSMLPKAVSLLVENVTTATHWPWDGKIDVTCDLTGSGKVQLSAALTTNGVTVCTATAANLTGATTINLDAAGGVTNGVKFVWDAKADCPAGFNSTDTKVKVTAEKVEKPEPAAGVQLWANGPFFAECNVGATKPEEYGALYKFDDAAKAVTDALGTEWRVPTDEEFNKLAGKNDGDQVCSNVWTTCNGVKGCRFFGMTSGYEDKNIFLPAAGYDLDDGRKNAGDRGYYWSSAEMLADFVWLLRFDEEDDPYLGFDNRSHGLSVRAVRDAK